MGPSPQQTLFCCPLDKFVTAVFALRTLYHQACRPALCVEPGLGSTVTVAPRLSSLLLACFTYTATLPRVVMRPAAPASVPTHSRMGLGSADPMFSGEGGGSGRLPLQPEVMVPVGVMEDTPAFDSGDGGDGFRGVDLLDPEEPDATGNGRRLGTVVKMQTLLHENARLVQLLQAAEARAAAAEAAALHAQREAHVAGVRPGPYEPPARPAVRGVAGVATSTTLGSPAAHGAEGGSGAAGVASPVSASGSRPATAHKFRSLYAAAATLSGSPAGAGTGGSDGYVAGSLGEATSGGPGSSSSLVVAGRAAGMGPAALVSVATGGSVDPTNRSELAVAGSNVADLAEMLFNDLETISTSFVDGFLSPSGGRQ